MYEEIPIIQVENLINIFLKDGRDGLVKELCIFEDKPNLNNIMLEMVDCMVATFIGEMQQSMFIENMAILNHKLYEEIMDTTLDEFNKGNLTSGEVTETLNMLQDTKATLDKIEKENS